MSRPANYDKLRREHADLARDLRSALGQRSLVLVGLMGCGKSSIGKRLAGTLSLSFVDADDEIEKAAGKSIPEIFADHGEAMFRDGERRVIARLLAGGPQVLATGGGAFMNADTRARIREAGVSVWLKAELAVLMKRVLRRDNRPLLKHADPEARMRELMDLRYPIYAEADLAVNTREVPHEVIVGELMEALAKGPLALPPAEPIPQNVTHAEPTSADPSGSESAAAEIAPPETQSKAAS